MSLASEFKEFAMRGNVVDLAVGIVIGGAFGKIVSSFVADVLMPPLGLLLGGVDFSDLVVTLKPALDAAHAGGDVELRQVHPVDRRLRDHRVRDLHADQGDEHDEEEGRSEAALKFSRRRRRKCCSRKFVIC